MTEPISHIPANKQEMSRVKEGDLVLITMAEDTFWTVFNNNENGEDTFIKQRDIKYKGFSKEDAIISYAVKRDLNDYNRNFGVIINQEECFEYLISNHNSIMREEYLDRVEKLKIAGLWQEQEELAGVKA